MGKGSSPHSCLTHIGAKSSDAASTATAKGLADFLEMVLDLLGPLQVREKYSE